MTGYTIRPVDGGDEEIADTLRDLHTLTFLGDAPTPDFEIGAWWLVFDTTNEPVGFAGITPSTYAANTGYMKRSGVLPAHRGRGLQRRLLRVRERYAKARNWCAVVTDTALHNVASANSLIACGFRLFRPDPLWCGEGWDYWRKQYAE